MTSSNHVLNQARDTSRVYNHACRFARTRLYIFGCSFSHYQIWKWRPYCTPLAESRLVVCGAAACVECLQHRVTMPQTRIVYLLSAEKRRPFLFLSTPRKTRNHRWTCLRLRHSVTCGVRPARSNTWRCIAMRRGRRRHDSGGVYGASKSRLGQIGKRIGDLRAHSARINGPFRRTRATPMSKLAIVGRLWQRRWPVMAAAAATDAAVFAAVAASSSIRRFRPAAETKRDDTQKQNSVFASLDKRW